MTIPEVPAKNAHRRGELDGRELNAPQEARFDRITSLARRLFDVPIARVSLVKDGKSASSIFSHAIMQDGVLVVPDARADARFKDDASVVGEPHIRFYAGCPLHTDGGRPIGTLSVCDRRLRALSEEDVELLKDLAAVVEQQLASDQTAMIDELTGLINGRGLMMVGDCVAGIALRSGVPLCVLIFDLAGCVAIDGQHGAAARDLALVAFAKALSRSFRESDVVARTGAEEFCVIMSEASASEVPKPLARLHAALSRLDERRSLGIDYSLGVTPFDPARHRGIGEVLDAAARSMETVKRAKMFEATKR